MCYSFQKEGANNLKAKKTENNNEGFDGLHILLVIHVYA